MTICHTMKKEIMIDALLYNLLNKLTGDDVAIIHYLRFTYQEYRDGVGPSPRGGIKPARPRPCKSATDNFEKAYKIGLHVCVSYYVR